MSFVPDFQKDGHHGFGRGVSNRHFQEREPLRRDLHQLQPRVTMKLLARDRHKVKTWERNWIGHLQKNLMHTNNEHFEKKPVSLTDESVVQKHRGACAKSLLVRNVDPELEAI
eukprot:2544192-Amphidinium_carterae.1